MRMTGCFVTLLLCAASCARRSPSVPARVVVDTGSVALALTHPCSRLGPQDVDSLWVPEPSAAGAVLGHVQRVLPLQAPDDVGRRAGAVHSYAVEVTGFYRKGERWLYAGFGDSIDAANPHLGVRWCDGGWRFFGVEYHVAADSIGPLRRNAVGYVRGQ
jgi:hypothetical protein